MNFIKPTQTSLVEARIRADRRRHEAVAWAFAVVTFVVVAFGGFWLVYVAVAVLKHFGVM